MNPLFAWILYFLSPACRLGSISQFYSRQPLELNPQSCYQKLCHWGLLLEWKPASMLLCHSRITRWNHNLFLSSYLLAQQLHTTGINLSGYTSVTALMTTYASIYPLVVIAKAFSMRLRFCSLTEWNIVLPLTSFVFVTASCSVIMWHNNYKPWISPVFNQSEVLLSSIYKTECFVRKFSSYSIFNSSRVVLTDFWTESLLSDMNINSSMVSSVISKLDLRVDSMVCLQFSLKMSSWTCSPKILQ